MIESNLHLIAKSRVHTPLNEWPDHNGYHRRTILGNWLFDHDCLRCWLEQVATEMIVKEAMPMVAVCQPGSKHLVKKG